ncbi:MAG: FadR family transcriptional regulator [Clostridium butyricum]|nr:FadR family transcriptional regulator [Clostridium butyricum]
MTEVNDSKVYEKIIYEIKDKIKKGELKKGDKLPTERAMADMFSVSRTSVREAVRALEVVGLIEKKHGDGNYIRTEFANSLFEPISIMFMLQESSLNDIIELREMLEIYCIKLTIKNISEDEIDLMNDILSKMYENNEEENIQLDVKLHNLIIRASRNVLLINIISVISQIMNESIKEFRKKIIYEKDNRINLLHIHERLVAGIQEKDYDKAVGALKDHFKLIRK